MTDFQLLREKMNDTGMTVTAISSKAGILRGTLYNKLNGKSEFSASEISTLSKILRLSSKERDQIFFAEEVE